MPKNEWQRRTERAEELIRDRPAAGEVLQFFVAITGLQEELWRELEGPATASADPGTNFFAQPLPSSLVARFGSFLSSVKDRAPAVVVQAAERLGHEDAALQSHVLDSFWQENAGGALPPGPEDFFARAFLQPYAVNVRSRLALQRGGPTPCLCPFCGRKPSSGVLRPLGDGGQRSLVCSLCLYEWEFRRIVCPACGEEDHAKLPVYTAEDPKHVRVECCDRCRCYIKTVDLTKNGLADPVVDEIGAIPLDLWAQDHGYAKLQLNLMQL
ncbi:MAG: formate dehydrogenase accessory protein FdhE [Acidobacteriia bacterium]|nr:formate dehydrogenase accessory protein FdhE [Terriglobia bacterium]